MGGTTNQSLQKNDTSNLKSQSLIGDLSDGMAQSKNAASDMYKEYKLMKSHTYKDLDDYYHCKANYNATKRGKVGEITSTIAGNEKEAVDYFKNRFYKGLSPKESTNDYWHDLSVNQTGRDRAKTGGFSSAQDACADYRARNKKLPEEFW